MSRRPGSPVGRDGRTASGSFDENDEASTNSSKKKGGMDEDALPELQDEKERNLIEEMRVKVKKFMSTHIVGRSYNNTLLVLSILSSLEFIYQTYLDPVADAAQIYYFSFIEVALAALFSFDWCLCFFIAEYKMLHFTSFYSMIDLLTVIPIWVTIVYVCPLYSSVYNASDAGLYFLCGLSTTRILRALRIRRYLLLVENEVSRFLGEMCLTLVVMILFNAALLQYLESESQPGGPLSASKFHEWMYFMIVTFSTTGYGDIKPYSDLGRMADMIMIAYAIATVPQLTGKLIELMSLESAYARAIFHPKKKKDHLFVCGDFSTTSLQEFFEELFHEDHENEELQTVVLNPMTPSGDMEAMLRHPEYSLNITYLEGSALYDKDLKRAKCAHAVAIFIMTNKFGKNPDEEDAKTILQQFSIVKHIMQARLAVCPYLCIQIIRPENKRHLISRVVEDDAQEDVIVCLNELKMGIIAKAALLPGCNTLIMNLLCSFADDEEEEKAQTDEREIENLDDDETGNWVGEYQRGCDWEIYTTELSSMFEGAVFGTLSEVLYQKMGIVLFGLQIRDLKREKIYSRILLNPADYIIPSKEDFQVEAFVIAKNKAMSDLSFSDADDGENENSSSIDVSSMIGGFQLPTLSHLNAKKASQQQAVSALAASNLVQPIEIASIKSSKQAWQMLLRKYDRGVEASSAQEMQQTAEDIHLRENYFTLAKRANMAECIIINSLAEEAPAVNAHTIVVGKSLSNIYDLIRPLRARYLGVMRPIVILTPNEIPSSVWNRISIFEGVFIVEGSPLEEEDVLRAGIFKAAQVIVLPDNADMDMSAVSGGAKSGLEALLDSDAVFTYQCVKKMNEHASVVVEIVRTANVSYLDPETGLVTGDMDFKFTPQFASGALFTSSLLDTLICQAFYNPRIINVLNQLVSGVDRKDRADIMFELSGGKVAEKKGVAALTGSAMYQISIPDLDNRTYGSLFKHLSKKGMIPLGLYRGVFPHTKVGAKSNQMPYVFTNPPKDAELFSCDKVYVLSQKPMTVGKSVRGAAQVHLDHSLTAEATSLNKLDTKKANYILASSLREEMMQLRSKKQQTLAALAGRLEATLDAIADRFE